MDDNRGQGRSVFGVIGPTSGTDFFHSLVEQLARSVEADCAWLAESIPGSEAKLRTLAVSIEGRDAQNFEYPIANTPAQNMFDDTGICLFPGDVRKRFPDDRILRVCNAGGYAGIPVVDSVGNVLGLLAVASRGPLANTRLLASQLRICANRATSELEGRSADAALSASEAWLKLMFDHSPDAYLLLTFDGKLLEANRAAERLTGLTRADMICRNVLIPGIMPEADIRRAAARLQVRAAGAPASQEEFTILQRNGGRAFVETYSEIVTIDGEKVMLLCIRDITSRKMAQQERQNQIDRAHQTMNNPQIVALGAETHSDYVRRIAAGTDFTVRDARTIEEFMDLIRDNACDVLLAEFPMADIGGEDLLTITRDTCTDCMTIFRVPSSSVAEPCSWFGSGPIRASTKRRRTAKPSRFWTGRLTRSSHARRRANPAIRDGGACWWERALE